MHPFILLHSFCKLYSLIYWLLSIVDRNYADITPEESVDAINEDIANHVEDLTTDEVDEDDNESAQKKKKEELNKT